MINGRLLKCNVLRFGKLLERGIVLYKLRKYSEASQLFDDALAINSQDFTANFWRARSAVAEKHFKRATHHLTVCKYLKRELDKPLIEPWETLIKYSIKGNDCISNEDFEKCSAETDDKLKYYQHYRDFNLLNILKLVICGAILIALVTLVTIDRPNEIRQIVFQCSALVSLILYFMHKPILPLNWWAECAYVLSKLVELLTTKSFIVFTGVFILLLKILIYFKGYHSIGFTVYLFIASIITYPTIEEIFYRGILYNFFKKYNKLFASVVVSIVFCLAHLSDASIWHFILSLILIWIYERYKTIIAPIIVHSIFNFIV